jgi:aromatic-amino-acid transaminase
VQALGGTGGLKVGADLLRRLNPAAQVWISDPSWENHRALFEYAGFTVNTYPYYDPATHGLNFDAMMAALGQLPAGSVVVLHACCHNPTGVDLTPQQWESVMALVRSRELVPFMDIAYQGFAEGLDEDAAAVRRFAEACPAVLVSSSFSKSLSLYGERTGALSIVTQSADEATRTLSQLKRVIRTNYSNPPTGGAKMVTTVLTTPELRSLWERELGAMRDRIKTMRRQLVDKIRSSAPTSTSASWCGSAGCSPTPASTGSRCGDCAKNIRSSPSTAGASASPRSTPATSTTWRRRWRACWCRKVKGEGVNV